MRIIDHDLRIGVKAKGFELAQELVENVSAIETGTGDAKPEKIQHTANSNSF